MKLERCFGTSDLYVRYHDKEWGVPVHDDRILFEYLVLEGAQAGLSWELILNRREAYRRVFHHFDPAKVAAMTDVELERVASDPTVIRNRQKVWSARQNAHIFLAIVQEFGSFDHYVWKFVGGAPIQNQWAVREEVPCVSDEGTVVSKGPEEAGDELCRAQNRLLVHAGSWDSE